MGHESRMLVRPAWWLALAFATAGCAKSTAPAAPPGHLAPAMADEEAHPAFAAHVAQLRRDGEIEIDEVVIKEQDIVGRLRELAADRPDELRLEVVGRVSDAWVARLEQYAADAGFASTMVLPDDL